MTTTKEWRSALLMMVGAAVIGYVVVRVGFPVVNPEYQTDDYRIVLPQPGSGAEVALYGTSTCPACGAAREFLRMKHVSFVDYDVAGSPAVRQRFVLLDSGSVPVIIMRDRKFIGFNQRALTASIAEFGLTVVADSTASVVLEPSMAGGSAVAAHIQ